MENGRMARHRDVRRRPTALRLERIEAQLDLLEEQLRNCQRLHCGAGANAGSGRHQAVAPAMDSATLKCVAELLLGLEAEDGNPPATRLKRRTIGTARAAA